MDHGKPTRHGRRKAGEMTKEAEPKRSIGRPRTLAERPERKGISLQPSEWAMLREYGGGYAGGIRRLIVEQRAREG